MWGIGIVYIIAPTYSTQVDSTIITFISIDMVNLHRVGVSPVVQGIGEAMHVASVGYTLVGDGAAAVSSAWA